MTIAVYYVHRVSIALFQARCISGASVMYMKYNLGPLHGVLLLQVFDVREGWPTKILSLLSLRYESIRVRLPPSCSSSCEAFVLHSVESFGDVQKDDAITISSLVNRRRISPTAMLVRWMSCSEFCSVHLNILSAILFIARRKFMLFCIWGKVLTFPYLGIIVMCDFFYLGKQNYSLIEFIPWQIKKIFRHHNPRISDNTEVKVLMVSSIVKVPILMTLATDKWHYFRLVHSR